MSRAGSERAVSGQSDDLPVNIKVQRRLGNNDNEPISSSIVGTPDIRALRAGYVGTPPPPNIPLRHTSGTPNNNRVTPSTSPFVPSAVSPRASPHPGPVTMGGISASRQNADVPPIVDLEDVPTEDKLRYLERHLVPVEQRAKVSEPVSSSAVSVLEVPSAAETGGIQSRRSSSGTAQRPEREESEPFPIHYDTHGADVTHDIYKWHKDQKRQVTRVRSASFAGPSQPPHPAFVHIHEPGGFRRNYVKLRANEQGSEEPQMLNNFIDFLLLFGHFAGEDLEEDDEDAKESDEETIAALQAAGLESGQPEPTESTHLLGSSRSRSRSRRRRNSVAAQGNATVTQAVLMLLKSFIGTGVLFLGKAFFNGGILFSAVTFTFIAVISLYSFLLLVKTKFVVSGSFGDIGGTLYGPWMRYLILASIVVSQLGFVAAYTIFVAENLQAFVMGITNCLKLIHVQYFILLQLIVFLPLALVRDLAKLSTTALIADAFILVGLLYIFGSEISIVMERGIADVKLFNPRDFPLFIGTAVFSFEGIGLVIPITDAMREPHKFPKVLTGVMAFLLLLFGGAGALAYLTFGSEIQTVVLVNLDSKSKMVQSVQFLYALAILLSIPLQFFPAVRILENGLFTRSGKADPRVKWLKNVFRFSLVLVCTLISWVGAADLDKFVAFIGCFACVPLCYVYPAMLHYRACSRTRKQKLADIALIIFGLCAAAYTSIQTLRLMLEPSPVKGTPHEICNA
ncbi:transmembrane amino acid transporter protein-domain-containing protein [Panaeolus papilionaceus]|nr:transmembrane amino acid transporter protein-domain-containing protein [Panaeolus papilionaceus]